MNLRSLSVPAGRRALPARIYGKQPNPTGAVTQTGVTGARSFPWLHPKIAQTVAPSVDPLRPVLAVNATVSRAAAPVRAGTVPGVSDIRVLAVAKKKGIPTGPVPGILTAMGSGAGAGGGAGGGTSPGGGGINPRTKVGL